MGSATPVDQLEAYQRIKRICPRVSADNCAITSRASKAYNCVAWVLADEKRWYEPTVSGQYYWPSEGASNYSLESYAEMFVGQGFVACETPLPENGFQKIALYGKRSEFSHVALQMPSGRWSSKLGGWEDVEHDTLEVLSGPIYGKPKLFMKRPENEQSLL